MRFRQLDPISSSHDLAESTDREDEKEAEKEEEEEEDRTDTWNGKFTVDALNFACRSSRHRHACEFNIYRDDCPTSRTRKQTGHGSSVCGGVNFEAIVRFER